MIKIFKKIFSVICNKKERWCIIKVKGQKKPMDNILTHDLHISAQTSARNEDLIDRIAFGDMDALHELYLQTSASVYGFALSITKNTHDAEDVLQDTFIIVHRKAKDYSSSGKALAWILTIAKNLSLMKLREKGRTTDIDELSNDARFSVSDGTDEMLILRSALSILDEEERNVVMLHSITGLRFKEISGLLELPLGTVLSKYHRAIKKMREFLKEKNNEK